MWSLAESGLYQLIGKAFDKENAVALLVLLITILLLMGILGIALAVINLFLRYSSGQGGHIKSLIEQNKLLAIRMDTTIDRLSGDITRLIVTITESVGRQEQLSIANTRAFGDIVQEEMADFEGRSRKRHARSQRLIHELTAEIKDLRAALTQLQNNTAAFSEGTLGLLSNLTGQMAVLKAPGLPPGEAEVNPAIIKTPDSSISEGILPDVNNQTAAPAPTDIQNPTGGAP